MTERFAMYDPALRATVLRLVARWKRLPFGDLLQMLSPDDQLRYRDDVLADLEWEGMVERRYAGDEPVIAITEKGLNAVQNDARGSAQPNAGS